MTAIILTVACTVAAVVVWRIVRLCTSGDRDE